MLDSALTAFAVTSARLNALATVAVYQSGDRKAIARLEAMAAAEQLRLDREFKAICIVYGVLYATVCAALIVALLFS